MNERDAIRDFIDDMVHGYWDAAAEGTAPSSLWDWFADGLADRQREREAEVAAQTLTQAKTLMTQAGYEWPDELLEQLARPSTTAGS